jgi:hypothetical protein
MATVKTPTGIHLVNCLDEAVFIHAGEALVELPKGPSPRLVTSPKSGESINIFYTDNETQHAPLTLYSSVEALGTIGLPPRVAGVWYLVDQDVLRDFPFRDDFVTSAMWEFLPDHADEVTGPMGPHVLVGITRAVAVDISVDVANHLPDFDSE